MGSSIPNFNPSDLNPSDSENDLFTAAEKVKTYAKVRIQKKKKEKELLLKVSELSDFYTMNFKRASRGEQSNLPSKDYLSSELKRLCIGRRSLPVFKADFALKLILGTYLITTIGDGEYEETINFLNQKFEDIRTFIEEKEGRATTKFVNFGEASVGAAGRVNIWTSFLGNDFLVKEKVLGGNLVDDPQ